MKPPSSRLLVRLAAAAIAFGGAWWLLRADDPNREPQDDDAPVIAVAVAAAPVTDAAASDLPASRSEPLRRGLSPSPIGSATQARSPSADSRAIYELVGQSLRLDDSASALQLVVDYAVAGPASTGAYDRPGAVDLLREALKPETVLPLAAEAKDTASATLLANVLGDRFRLTASSDPAAHREYSRATALAVEFMSGRSDLTPGQRVSFATSVLNFAFADTPDTRIALLERVGQRVEPPPQPDASYAHQYRVLMPEYARRGQTALFDRAAALWQQHGWPQREADRQWRAERIERLRAENPPDRP